MRDSKKGFYAFIYCIGSVKCLYACIYWKKWRFGQVLPTDAWQTTEDGATQLLYSIQFKLSHAMMMILTLSIFIFTLRLGSWWGVLRSRVWLRFSGAAGLPGSSSWRPKQSWWCDDHSDHHHQYSSADHHHQAHLIIARAIVHARFTVAITITITSANTFPCVKMWLAAPIITMMWYLKRDQTCL